MKKASEDPVIIFSIIFNILLVFFTAGCGKIKEDRIIRIGVTDVNSQGKFQTYIEEGMKKYQETLRDKVEVVYLDAKEDVDKQIEQVRYFIREGMDAVVVIPADTSIEGTSEMTRLTEAAKIPIIYVNKFPNEFVGSKMPEHAYYIGSQEKSAGEIQMEYLAEKLGEKGKVAILMGDLTSSKSTFERTDGVEEVAGRYPEIEIVEKGVANWLMPMADSVVRNWLSEGKEIDAIVANNDEMAIGAMRGLEDYGMAGKVMVLGIDATDEAIAELKTGKLTATVFQDGDRQGRGALETAVNVVRGEKVDNITWIPFKLVTFENYKNVPDRD